MRYKADPDTYENVHQSSDSSFIKKQSARLDKPNLDIHFEETPTVSQERASLKMDATNTYTRLALYQNTGTMRTLDLPAEAAYQSLK